MTFRKGRDSDVAADRCDWYCESKGIEDLTIESMNERAAMLADVADQVLLMKHDLAGLLRGLRP